MRRLEFAAIGFYSQLVHQRKRGRPRGNGVDWKAAAIHYYYLLLNRKTAAQARAQTLQPRKDRRTYSYESYGSFTLDTFTRMMRLHRDFALGRIGLLHNDEEIRSLRTRLQNQNKPKSERK